MLTLNDHTKKVFAKARRAQNRVRSLMSTKGLSPKGCQRIQVATVQAVALYGAELWWKGQKNRAQEVQKILNEQGRRVTGCFRTTPQGALMNDAGIRPATAILNNQVRRYKMRQMMMPDAVGGGRMIAMEGNVVRRVEGIDELIPEDYPLERRSYERTTIPEIKKRLKGQVIIQEEEQVLEEARKERDGLVLWTDGSRKEDEWVGCTVIWKEERWNKRRMHLGRQKEAFDAEMYAMSEAVKIADEICQEKEVRKVTVFTDSQATLQRIQSDEPGPRQALTLRTMNWKRELADKNIQVEYQWVPAHNGVEGNEEADSQATKAAYKYCGSYTEMQNPQSRFNYVSFAHIGRRLTEVKWEESLKEIKEMGTKSKQSYRYDLVKRGGNEVAMESKKSIAARFYQLKTGHALTGKYLRRIGKRRDMKCWWCGHEYQTRDHLFKCCKRWKREQKRLWVDGKEGEDGYEGIEKVMKKPKISLPVSLVFAEEKCTQALLDFLYHTDVGRISGVAEEAENSDHEESSDGGV